MKTLKVDDLVTHDGRQWRVLSVGVTRDDGHTFYHLASTTEFTTRRNGRCPKQITVWL